MIEQELWEHLKNSVPLVEQRVYANIIAQTTAFPAMVYTVTKELATGGPGCADNNRYREWNITVYAERYLLAKEIKEQIVVALKSFANNVYNIEISDGFEETHELFAQIVNFKTGRS